MCIRDSGYTNSGKSTLFNKLTKSNVLSKDMLFASLDSTIRKSFFKNINLLFVDTVGFISDLPTTLVDSFKSTLDEIIYSDLILHIRDVSNDYYLEQKKEVLKIHFESKNTLDKDIQSKKESMEKEIDKEILKAQKEISELKKNSISSIQIISGSIVSNIIENISGDKLNESSIKATVEDVTKKNMNKFL